MQLGELNVYKIKVGLLISLYKRVLVKKCRMESTMPTEISLRIYIHCSLQWELSVSKWFGFSKGELMLLV